MDRLVGGPSRPVVGPRISDPHVTSKEWLETPIPLVAVMGRPDIHAAMFQNFPNNKKIRWATFPPDHVFPSKKPRKTSYEGYNPAGLIPSLWVHKHTQMIPAVCLQLLEWDPNRSWEQWEHILSAMLGQFKTNAKGHSMKLILVFVRATTARSDDLDKVSRVAKKCGLDHASKSTCFLTTSDFKPHLRRLEEIAWDHACDYYRAYIKRIKAHKSKVSRTTQQRLYVRHHLKIAFFAEMIKDINAANKYYGSAYAYLKQVHVSYIGYQCLELKAVAEVLNYKLMRKLLSLSKEVEALEQFQRHIAHYYKMVGLSAVAFMHWAWMSRQHTMLAELLDAAATVTANTQAPAKKGLTSGCLYQTAAAYALKRKDAWARNSHGLAIAYEEVPTAHFLGQAPTMLPDGKTLTQEAAIKRTCVQLEAGLDHSAHAITLLTKSYESFKKEKSNRQKLHVASMMAAEYKSAGNYAMAKRFLDSIARTYRSEKWHSILYSILLSALDCARYLQEYKEMANYALELLAHPKSSTQPQRVAVLNELLGLIKPDHPSRQAVVANEFPVDPSWELVVAQAQLHAVAASVHVKQDLELELIMTCQFPRTIAFESIQICFNPQGSSGNPYDVTLRAVGGIDVSVCGADEEEIHVDPSLSPRGATVNLVFAPSLSRTLRLKFRADFPVSGALSCHSLLLAIRPTGSECSPMLLRVPCTETTVDQCMLRPSSSLTEDFLQEWYSQSPQGIARLGKPGKHNTSDSAQVPEARSFRGQEVGIDPARPKAFLEVDQCGPALAGEYHRLGMTVHSDADSMANTVITLDYCAHEGDEGQDEVRDDEQQHFFTLQGEASSRVQTVDVVPVQDGQLTLPRLETQTQHRMCVYALCARAGRYVVRVRMRYDNEEGVNLTYVASFQVTVQQPLKVSYCLFSQRGSSTQAAEDKASRPPLVSGDTCIVHARVVNTSPHPIRLFNATLDATDGSSSSASPSSAPSPSSLDVRRMSSSGLVHVELSKNPFEGGVLLRPTEQTSAVFALVAHGHTETPVSFAMVNVLWCRCAVQAVDGRDRNTHVDAQMQNNSAVKLDGNKSLTHTSAPPSYAIRTRAITDARTQTSNGPVIREDNVHDKPVEESDRDDEEEELMVHLDPQEETKQTASKGTPRVVPVEAGPLQLATVFTSALPAMEVLRPPIKVQMTHPASCTMGQSVLLRVVLANVADEPYEVQVSVRTKDKRKQSPSVCFSGKTNTRTTVLPHSHHTLRYRLFPLECGLIQVPRVSVKLQSGKSLVDPQDIGVIFVAPAPAV